MGQRQKYFSLVELYFSAKRRDGATGGSEESVDPPDFSKLECKNAIKCSFWGQFLCIFGLLTPLTFRIRTVPGKAVVMVLRLVGQDVL